jgi:dTMP kinase
MRGLFITFEGIEGSGKSTQAALLKEKFDAAGLPCVLTREPGGTALGVELRKIVLEGGNVFPVAELLIFLADRNQHVRETILPALEAGSCVICDRFSHSTWAYQIGGRGLPESLVKTLDDAAVEGCRPDMTFFVDVPVETGFARKARAEMTLDRMEREERAFHEQLRERYIFDAERDQRVETVDGTMPREKVSAEVLKLVKLNWPMRLSGLGI